MEVGAAAILPYKPIIHAVHAAEELAATTLPKPPAGHTVQEELPVDSALYAPAAHAVHAAEVRAAATLP